MPQRVIELHSSATYLVYFLGFAPGFAYLGELPQELVTPRLPSPRKRVPAGSGGIEATITGGDPFQRAGSLRRLGHHALAGIHKAWQGLNLPLVADPVRL